MIRRLPFRRPFSPLLAALVAVLILGACTSPPPYVYQANEFDRGRPDFGQEPTDADEIIVCYGKMGTNPAQVVAVATAECSRFGKAARFSHQGILTCPLSTPISAHYDCVAPAPAR